MGSTCLCPTGLFVIKCNRYEGKSKACTVCVLLYRLLTFGHTEPRLSLELGLWTAIHTGLWKCIGSCLESVLPVDILRVLMVIRILCWRGVKRFLTPECYHSIAINVHPIEDQKCCLVPIIRAPTPNFLKFCFYPMALFSNFYLMRQYLQYPNVCL